MNEGTFNVSDLLQKSKLGSQHFILLFEELLQTRSVSNKESQLCYSHILLVELMETQSNVVQHLLSEQSSGVRHQETDKQNKDTSFAAYFQFSSSTLQFLHFSSFLLL